MKARPSNAPAGSSYSRSRVHSACFAPPEARRDRERQESGHAPRRRRSRCGSCPTTDRRAPRPAAAAWHRRSRRRARSAAATTAARQAGGKAGGEQRRRQIHRRAAAARGRTAGAMTSRQPQIATGSTSAIAARPKSCISRSAAMAPGAPSRLRTGALVAWLRLGSCTDQVASASVASTASSDQREAASFAQPAPDRRRANHRTGSEDRSRGRALACRVTRARRQGDAAPRRWFRVVVHHARRGYSRCRDYGRRPVAREVMAGNARAARLAPKLHASPPRRRRAPLTSSQRKKPPAGRSIAVAIADDLVGEIEFLRHRARGSLSTCASSP